MRTSDFDFDLPEDLIAQFPTEQRAASRLLCLDGNTGELSDRMFSDLLQLVRPGDVMVFNDTRVIKARLFGAKQSGGKVELLIERVLDTQHALAHIRASHGPKPDSRIDLEGGAVVTVLERNEDLYRLRFEGDKTVLDVLEEVGHLPLPPYISREADNFDENRYQTVYARHPGAVAAPTAGLHFDDAMLSKLREQGVVIAYVTLHVGAGTFQPVRVENVAEHRIHTELYQVPEETAQVIRNAKAAGQRVMAVGTTSLRALESASASGELVAGLGETNLFIVPGYHFKMVDRLLTNFHLPRSTLLMLVSAFGGMDNILRAYGHAIQERYRFFSYGDAMLIERRQD